MQMRGAFYAEKGSMLVRILPFDLYEGEGLPEQGIAFRALPHSTPGKWSADALTDQQEGIRTLILLVFFLLHRSVPFC